MSDFVNIRPGTDTPLLLNTKNLSVVTRMPTKSTEPENMTIVIHDALRGSPLWLNETAHEINFNVAISAIRISGADLFEIPLAWADGRQYNTAFVSPQAFIAATTSAVHIPESKTEEHAALRLEMAGYGPVESHAVPVKTIDAFMMQVQALKSDLLRIDPAIAHSTFTEPGYVVFDASRLSTIRPNGYDIDIYLQGNESHTARIGFHLQSKDGHKPLLKGDLYAAALVERASKRGFAWPRDPDEYQNTMDDITRRSWRRFETRQAQLKNAFAAAVAAHKPDLIKIENAKEPFYATAQAVSSISCRDKTLSLSFRSTDVRRSEILSVDFPSAETARSELKRLQPLLCAP